MLPSTRGGIRPTKQLCGSIKVVWANERGDLFRCGPSLGGASLSPEIDGRCKMKQTQNSRPARCISSRSQIYPR